MDNQPTIEVPFNKAFIAGRELYYIAQAVARGELKGDGPFTRKCSEWIQSTFSIQRALITHSCTGALEMAAILFNLEAGDEVIMPSFTFTSTANAFLLRGAQPVFVDVDADDLNISPEHTEAAITSKTKAVCVMHYAGVACQMDRFQSICKAANIRLVEDAAHAIMAKYKDKWLGSIGDLATFSFHETKNYSCGEGGALLLNSSKFAERAEIIREKGTNRSKFFRGEVDKYSWCDVGGSFLPSEIISAFLYGQLEHAFEINDKRLEIWNRYYELLQPLQNRGYFTLPKIPAYAQHNAHLFYLLLDSEEERNALMSHCKRNGVGAVFHYIPLHLSPMGEHLGYRPGQLPVSEDIASRILRLPIFMEITPAQQELVSNTISDYFSSAYVSQQTSLVGNL